MREPPSVLHRAGYWPRWAHKIAHRLVRWEPRTQFRHPLAATLRLVQFRAWADLPTRQLPGAPIRRGSEVGAVENSCLTARSNYSSPAMSRHAGPVLVPLANGFDRSQLFQFTDAGANTQNGPI